MNSSKKSIRFPFFVAWVLVNIIGWACCSISQIIGYFPKGAGLGAIILLSFLQWLVLRKMFDIDAMWFWSSLLTYTLFLLAIFYGIQPNKQNWFFVGVIILGLGGITQKLVLRNYLNKENTWLIVSPVAGAVALLAAGVLAGNSYQLAQTYQLTWPYWTILGLCYGAITGLGLAWMSGAQAIQGDISQ